MTPIAPTDAALGLAAGLVLGAFYFALLGWTVRLHVARSSALGIISLTVLRLAAAVSAFWAIAQLGGVPLLLALLGFVFARIAVQRWMGAV